MASTYSIRAVERVCEILDLLQQEKEGISLHDAATRTGLPRSSAFRYLVSLEARRYAERDAITGNFRPGMAFLPVQFRQLDLVGHRARPRLEELRDELQETINLGLLDGNRIIYLEVLESPRSIRLAPERGSRDWLHATALGKAIAAQLPESDVQDMLVAESMPQLTSNTITDVDTYLKELVQVRKQGWALEDCENDPDGRCVAVPLLRSRLPIALSVSAPSQRLPYERVEEVAGALRDVADDLDYDRL